MPVKKKPVAFLTSIKDADCDAVVGLWDALRETVMGKIDFSPSGINTKLDVLLQRLMTLLQDEIAPTLKRRSAGVLLLAVLAANAALAVAAVAIVKPLSS